MHVYIRAFIQACKHTQILIKTCIYIQRHSYKDSCTHTDAHTECMYIPKCSYMHAHTHTLIQHACQHMCSHKHVCTHRCSHKQACTHKTYKHIYIHTLKKPLRVDKMWIKRNQTRVKADTEAPCQVWRPNFSPIKHGQIWVCMCTCAHTPTHSALHQGKQPPTGNGKQKPPWLTSVFKDLRHHKEQNKNGQGSADSVRGRIGRRTGRLLQNWLKSMNQRHPWKEGERCH